MQFCNWRASCQTMASGAIAVLDLVSSMWNEGGGGKGVVQKVAVIAKHCDPTSFCQRPIKFHSLFLVIYFCKSLGCWCFSDSVKSTPIMCGCVNA